MSWHYTPVPVVDSWQGNSWDSKPCATSRTTPIASKSLKLGLQRAICATRRYGTTLLNSTGDPGLDVWILSLEAGHANRFQSPGSKKENTTPVTSGRTPFASLEKSGPNGSFLRTSQPYLAGIMDISDEYCVTFPKAGIMCDGIAYPLQPSWRPIKGTGSGLLVGTPTASMTVRSQAFAEGRLPTPAEAAENWRTPSVSDGEGGVMEMREGKTGHYKLRDHVQEKNKHMWPTPRKCTAMSATLNEKLAAHDFPNLETVVARIMWPTPQAQESGNKPETYDAEKGRRITKDGHDYGMGLAPKVAVFPTPSTVDDGSFFNKSKSPGATKRPTLGAMAKFGLWPTPASRDWRSGHASEDTMNRNSRPLNETVTNYPTPTALQGHCSGRLDEYGGKGNPFRGTPEGQGKLNPDWVEWLMGWPIGWSDLEPLENITLWEENVASWWEADPADTGHIPRVTQKNTNRVNRLKAIGNGQVPLCAAIAFLILQGDLICT